MLTKANKLLIEGIVFTWINLKVLVYFKVGNQVADFLFLLLLFWPIVTFGFLTAVQIKKEGFESGSSKVLFALLALIALVSIIFLCLAFSFRHFHLF